MPNTAYQAVLGTLTVRQILSSSFSANGSPIEGVTSGAVDVAEYFGGQVDLRASFETQDLTSVAGISNIATAGLAISAGTITVPYQLRANLSTFAGTLAHYVLSGANGLVIPTGFSLPAGGDATCSLECIFISTDGETVPVTVNVSQTLSSETFQGVYTLGPVSVNGTTLDRVISATVTPGIDVQVHMYRHNYAREAFIVRRRPVIEIQTYDLATLNALGPAWGLGTACVVYARRRSGTSFALDAATDHVKFSFADGIVKPVESIAGAGVGGNSTRTLRFHGETLTIAGSSAIT